MENKYVHIARKNGIVGAGGAGFPTHVKLSNTADYLVINGAECEPLMTVDQYLMTEYAAPLVKTLSAIGRELETERVLIGVKAKHKEAIKSMNVALAAYPEIEIIELEDRYPAGDEYVLVYETIGRSIPQGGIPLDCGVVVSNAETIWNLWQAEQGTPLTHKWVTVSGEVRQPGIYRVPIGVSVGEMIWLADGAVIDDYHVLNGGPMMGKLVENMDEPITKTTKGLLVLRKDNPAVINRLRPIEQILRVARSTCCQCSMCTDICPRHLLGYSIRPDKTILSAGYAWTVGGDTLSDAQLCSECGVCDMYACPMGLSPRRINQILKQQLADNKIPVPEKGRKVWADQWREHRRIPTKRLVGRLNLASYESPVKLIEKDWKPDKVHIPLKQHIGASATAVVKAGDNVNCGQLIGEIPEKALGSTVFASIKGIVDTVSDSSVTIRKA